MKLPDGSQAVRELVLHPGAVAILARDQEGRFVLVRQFRAAADGFLWEIPAGKLEPEESPLQCAQRELLEETGFVAEAWEEVQAFYTTPGFSDERMTLFAATTLRSAATRNEEEIAEQIAVSPARFREMIEQGLIVDGKTLLAFYARVNDRLP